MNSSLDPNEDPVTGLARVASINSMQAAARRNERRRQELERQSQFRRQQSANEAEHILSEKFESLDYEIVENELYRDEETSKDHQVGIFISRTFCSFYGFVILLLIYLPESVIQTIREQMGCLFLDRNMHSHSCCLHRHYGVLQRPN